MVDIFVCQLCKYITNVSKILQVFIAQVGNKTMKINKFQKQQTIKNSENAKIYKIVIIKFKQNQVQINYFISLLNYYIYKMLNKQTFWNSPQSISSDSSIQFIQCYDQQSKSQSTPILLKSNINTSLLNHHPKNISQQNEIYTIKISIDLFDKIQILCFQYNKSTLTTDLIKYFNQITKLQGVEYKSGHYLIDYFFTISTNLYKLKQKELYFKLSFKQNIRYPYNSLKRYEFIKQLCAGAYSEVYLVKTYGMFAAMKLLTKQNMNSPLKLEMIQKQKQLLLQFQNNPFVPKLYHTFETESYFCIVMQYCQGGDFFDFLERKIKLSESQARFYFLQILCVIKALHDKNICYRDLKPQNIVIDYTGHIKIIDFGGCKNMGDSLQYKRLGTPTYSAPQIHMNAGYTKNSDLFSLGIVLYLMLIGKRPFEDQNRQKEYDNIIHKQFKFPKRSNLTQQVKNLIEGLLEKDPRNRITIQEILSHPWIKKTSIEQVMAKKLKPPKQPNPLFNYFQDQEKDISQQNRIFWLRKGQDDLKNQISGFENFYYESPQLRIRRLQFEDKDLDNKKKLKNMDIKIKQTDKIESIMEQQQIESQVAQQSDDGLIIFQKIQQKQLKLKIDTFLQKNQIKQQNKSTTFHKQECNQKEVQSKLQILSKKQIKLQNNKQEFNKSEINQSVQKVSQIVENYQNTKILKFRQQYIKTTQQQLIIRSSNLEKNIEYIQTKISQMEDKSLKLINKNQMKEIVNTSQQKYLIYYPKIQISYNGYYHSTYIYREGSYKKIQRQQQESKRKQVEMQQEIRNKSLYM